MAHANAVMAHATSPALANTSLPPPSEYQQYWNRLFPGGIIVPAPGQTTTGNGGHDDDVVTTANGGGIPFPGVAPRHLAVGWLPQPQPAAGSPPPGAPASGAAAPPLVPRPPGLRLPAAVEIAWKMLETILRTMSLRSALNAWLWQEEREPRKYLSHFGTISLGAVPTHLRQAAASVAWTDGDYAGTLDAGNRCYHAALRIVVGEPVPFELAVLNKESAGDLLEAVLGAELVLCQLAGLQGPAGARLRAARKEVEDAVNRAMAAGHWV